jgi:hypothetical protein
MTDGAGAVIVASEEIVKRSGFSKPVRIETSTVRCHRVFDVRITCLCLVSLMEYGTLNGL